jgi:hypothetical protein
MSVDKAKHKNNLDTPSLGKVVRDFAWYDQQIEALHQHKTAILAILRKEYERGPKSKPFEEDNAWCYLILLAKCYFGSSDVKRSTIPATERVERLRKLERALAKASNLADKALQEDLNADFFMAWCETLDRYDFGLIDEFDKMVKGLSALGQAASRAADNVPPKRPGPVAILPSPYIEKLAGAYLESTGREPGAGYGPFARMVMEFRAALDPSYKTTDESGDSRLDESMIETIKKALRRWRRAREGSIKHLQDGSK